jgi:hypothetical protein
MRTILFLLALCFSWGSLSVRAADTDNTPVKVPREQLRYDGKTFEQWRDSLLTELKPERRVEALKALRSFGVRGYGREAASAMAHVLKDGFAQGIGAREVESALRTADKDGRDDEAFVVGHAAEAFMCLGDPAVPFLVELLKGPTGQDLLADTLESGHFTDAAFKSSVPALVQEVCGGKPKTSVYAAGLLAIHLDGLATALKETLKNDRQAKRFMAAVAALPAAVCDDDFMVALRALDLLHPQQRVPALLQAYQKLPAQRCRIAAALGELGPSAREALPVLTKALQDPNEELRQAAAAAIQEINAKKKTPEQD